jgi:FkbM family methyltransferase
MINNFCIFTNDDNVKINLPDHQFSSKFSTRDNHESIFRRINTILIKNKIITGNIIDLGCWIGDNALPWSKNIDGLVFAIDPGIENCDFVRELIEINDVKNIKVLQEVISDRKEIVSTNEDLSHASFQSNDIGRIKLETKTLDDLYENTQIHGIGYIHLDVEGMEFKVIKGSEKIINYFQPIITFEQHLEIDNYIELSNYLKERRYSVFLINESLPGCRPDCRNFIAFPDRIGLNTIKTSLIDVLNIPQIFTVI